jgi:hypothetical protein
VPDVLYYFGLEDLLSMNQYVSTTTVSIAHMATTKTKPFPLGNTLRDLALLRASEIDISGLLPTTMNTNHATFDGAVEESYELVREARKALKIQNGCSVGRQGERVEEVRNKLEELVE